MVTYGTVLYFFVLPSDFGFYEVIPLLKIIALIFIGTALIPATTLFLFSKLGIIKSVRIEEQRERNFPLLLGSLIYFGTFYLLRNKDIPVFILLFLLGAILGILISLVVNLRWKISLHMIGIGGLCGGLTVIYYYLQEGNPLWLGVWFMLAGILGTARLIVNAHTPLQVLAGFVLGFAAEFLLAFFVISR
jgi:membrane-associated phospholipid phosphatase